MLFLLLCTALIAAGECESWLKRSLEYQEIPLLSRSATMISGRGFRPGKRALTPAETTKYVYGRTAGSRVASPHLLWVLPSQPNYDSS